MGAFTPAHTNEPVPPFVCGPRHDEYVFTYLKMRSESERIPYSRFSSDDYQTMNTSAYILITHGVRGTHVYSCTQHSRSSVDRDALHACTGTARAQQQAHACTHLQRSWPAAHTLRSSSSVSSESESASHLTAFCSEPAFCSLARRCNLATPHDSIQACRHEHDACVSELRS